MHRLPRESNVTKSMIKLENKQAPTVRACYKRSTSTSAITERSPILSVSFPSNKLKSSNILNSFEYKEIDYGTENGDNLVNNVVDYQKQ